MAGSFFMGPSEDGGYDRPKAEQFASKTQKGPGLQIPVDDFGKYNSDQYGKEATPTGANSEKIGGGGD